MKELIKKKGYTVDEAVNYLVEVILKSRKYGEFARNFMVENGDNSRFSLMYCLKYIRMRSGRAKTRPISIKYFPRVEIGLTIFFQNNFSQKYCFLAIL